MIPAADVSSFETGVNILLFTMLVITAFGIVVMDRLFAVVMLASVFSLLSALLYVALDAVDVAFTEAAVGAGISTVLMLSTIALTARTERACKRRQTMPMLVVFATGAALVYGTLDIPDFGDPNAPINLHVAPQYISQSPEQIGVPNIVTSILASYRGYDTMGETAVVFTAGIGVLLLISALARPRRREDSEGDTEQ
jgi:multicomponent Na+:H+ antiporter subunit B